MTPAPKLAIVDGKDPAALSKMASELSQAASAAAQKATPAADRLAETPQPPYQRRSIQIPNDPVAAKKTLEIPNLSDIAERICKAGAFDRAEVENACVGLTLGNLMLAGPPGTGKTRLARDLAREFRVEAIAETANPEWSVYDVIGSQTLAGAFEAEPRHGVVTSAIVRCYACVQAQMLQAQAPQAAWLIIDEINRAEIDRAFGPLFTALSGEAIGQYPLDYVPGGPILKIPARFRIIATLNSFDTRFVNSMSAALRRRFARAMVLPPASNPVGSIPYHEYEIAMSAATERVSTALGTKEATSRSKVLNGFQAEVRRIFASIREPVDQGGKRRGEGIPVGTAQIIDSLAFALGLLSVTGTPQTAEEFWGLLDRALAVQLANSFESDNLRGRINKDFITDLKAEYTMLPRLCARLEAFVMGRE